MLKKKVTPKRPRVASGDENYDGLFADRMVKTTINAELSDDIDSTGMDATSGQVSTSSSLNTTTNTKSPDNPDLSLVYEPSKTQSNSISRSSSHKRSDENSHQVHSSRDPNYHESIRRLRAIRKFIELIGLDPKSKCKTDEFYQRIRKLIQDNCSNHEHHKSSSKCNFKSNECTMDQVQTGFSPVIKQLFDWILPGSDLKPMVSYSQSKTQIISPEPMIDHEQDDKIRDKCYKMLSSVEKEMFDLYWEEYSQNKAINRSNGSIRRPKLSQLCKDSRTNRYEILRIVNIHMERNAQIASCLIEQPRGYVLVSILTKHLIEAKRFSKEIDHFYRNIKYFPKQDRHKCYTDNPRLFLDTIFEGEMMHHGKKIGWRFDEDGLPPEKRYSRYERTSINYLRD